MSEDQNDNETQDSPNFKRLREKLEATEADNSRLRQQAANNMVRLAGYDASHPTTELVLEKYLGAEEADLTPEAFTEFAKTHSLPKVESQSEEGGDEAPDHSDSFDHLQRGADQLRRSTSQAGGAPSVKEKIAEAEASGDFDTAMALKSQRLQKQMLDLALKQE